MEIIFAGASHLGLGGYKSLFPYFKKIFLIRKNTKEVLENIREQDEVIDDFDSVDCEWVFLCGYTGLITKEQLERKKYINVHGALLPKYRGMHSTFYAIMNGEKQLGITIHLVNEFIDAGDILARFSFPYIGQSVKKINNEIDHIVEEYSGKIINDYLHGRIIPTPQNDNDALFGARRNLQDCLIDFAMENQLLHRFFKALTPDYPYPMLLIRDELYEVLPEVRIIDKEYFGPLGRVVYVNELGTWVKTKDGFLIVDNIRKYGTSVKIKLSEIIPLGYRFIIK